MSGISWFDIFLRLIPEGFIIILAGYAVSRTIINAKLYIISSVVLALITYVFKILPISAALPMILSAIVAIILLVYINKIKVIFAVISTIACMILTLLFEGVNIFVLGTLLGIDPDTIFQNTSTILRNVYGLPSLFLFAAIVLTYYLISRRKAKKNVVNE